MPHDIAVNITLRPRERRIIHAAASVHGLSPAAYISFEAVQEAHRSKAQSAKFRQGIALPNEPPVPKSRLSIVRVHLDRDEFNHITYLVGTRRRQHFIRRSALVAALHTDAGRRHLVN